MDYEAQIEIVHKRFDKHQEHLREDLKELHEKAEGMQAGVTTMAIDLSAAVTQLATNTTAIAEIKQAIADQETTKGSRLWEILILLGTVAGTIVSTIIATKLLGGS